MDTNNLKSSQPYAQPPSIANGGRPETDLYKEIAKNDEEIVVVPTAKKRQLPFMGLVVLFMKITFYFDSVRRTNESLFNLLGGIWRGFMFLIYLGGIATLFMSIYARMKLPLELENFFESHNLKYDSLKMADFSLSRINVSNLHDVENKYVIPSLNVHSTFADFLQGRIRTVTVDGLRLNLKSSGTDENSLENVLKVLGMIANPMESGLALDVNSVTINNATLNIEGTRTKIPVNFSMSGLYTNEAQVIIPFMIDEEFLKVDATLAISGTEQKRNLEFTIKSGTLALPNRAPEELQGTVVITTKKDQINSIQTNLNLNYGYVLKTIQTDLAHSEKGFSGKLSLLAKNTSEKNSKSMLDLALSLDELKVEKDGLISTTAPIQMKINRLSRNTTFLEGVEGTLNGELKCSLSQMNCQYDLSKEAVLSYQNLATRYKEQNIVIDDSGSLTFLPTQGTLSLQLQDSKIALNWNISKIDLNGFYNVQTNPIHLSADSCQLSGHFSTQINQDMFDVKVENGVYQTQPLTMKGIQLSADDLYNAMAPIYFSAEELTTSSPLLTQPVSVDMTYLNRKVRANIQVKDTDIKIIAEGTLQPFQKTFSGQFKMPAVELKDIPFALSELSSIFSKRINQPSGLVTASGQLNFSGSANISGPLYVGLKNLNFNLDDTPIQQMDGVITLQSLLPLVSSPNQNIFVGKIDALVPLTNVKASFQMENQAVRLLGADAELGNEKLFLSGALIPYRKPSALLYFKSEKDFEMVKFIPFMDFVGITPVGGTGSLAVPVDVSEKGITIPSMTLKMNNVTLRQKAGKKSDISLFDQGNDAYMIRNGQFIYNKGAQLQVDLDGWLMPMRKRVPFAQKDIHLTTPLFKSGEMETVPSKIQDGQKILFQ